MTGGLDRLRVPVPAEYRAARAVLARGRPVRSAGDLTYAVYVVIVVAAALLPVAWTALRGVGRALAEVADPSSALVLATTILAAVAAGGARHVGLLSTSAPEVTFLLQGQFPPQVVFARRAAASVLTAAAGGALVAVALCQGAGVGAAVLDAVAGGVGGTSLALACAAGQGSLRRPALLVTGGLSGAVVLAGLLLGRLGVPGRVAGGTATAVPAGAVLAGELLLLTGALLVSSSVLASIDPEALLVRQSHWQAAHRSVLTGDQRAATLHLSRRPTRRDGHLVVRWPGARLVLARDLLGLYRTRGRTAASGALAVAALAVPAAGVGAGSVWTVLAALVLFACTGRWVEGLAAHVDNAAGSGLTPHSPQRLFCWHAATPVVLGAAATGLATAVALLSGAATPARTALALALALLCTSARAWVTSQTLLPLSLLTPVVGPFGDLSSAVVSAWFLRGWVLVASVALLAAAASDHGAGAPGTLLRIALGAGIAIVLTGRTIRTF